VTVTPLHPDVECTDSTRAPAEIAGISSQTSATDARIRDNRIGLFLIVLIPIAPSHGASTFTL
jgi:hypothetical protein